MRGMTFRYAQLAHRSLYPTRRRELFYEFAGTLYIYVVLPVAVVTKLSPSALKLSQMLQAAIIAHQTGLISQPGGAMSHDEFACV